MYTAFVRLWRPPTEFISVNAKTSYRPGLSNLVPPKKNRKEEIWLEIYPIALIAQSAESDGQIARFGHLNRYTGRTMNAKNSLYICRRYEKKVGGI